MLKALNIMEWLRLLGGIIAFLGPGLCIITIFYKDALKSLTHWFVLSITLSACTCGILLAWLKILNIRINLAGILILCLSGWLIAIVYLFLNKGKFGFRRFTITVPELLLFFISVASGLIVLWSLRNQVAGLGSDSYHHTLITQLIYDNGGLPNNYQPATDQLITFSYHYGYHAVMAALMWLSGWESRLLVLVSSAFLVMLSTFSIGLLTDELTEKPFAGTISGAMVGLVFVFPTYMLNWGRYPQLAALSLLAVFLLMIISYFKNIDQMIDYRKIILIAFVATGVAITHYRITIMAVMAVISLILFIKSGDKYYYNKNIQFLIAMLLIAGMSIILFSPWLWNVIQSHRIGYSIGITEVNTSYYSINRLGVNVLNYPTNPIVILITVCGLIWGIIKKKWFVFWIAIWVAVMLLLSGPGLISESMDRISVVISLYLPLAIIAGWITEEAYSHLKQSFRIIMLAGLLLIFIWSGNIAVKQNLWTSGFVTPEDLAAAEWIKDNTPSNAYFAVNTFKFGFASNFVIGIDAGYWLPLLAHRQTVTIPMIFDIEKFQSPDGLQQLIGLYNLGADLSTPRAIEFLKTEGISYVYIGENGGQIDVTALLSSHDFDLIYQQGKVYVFKIE